MKKDFERYMEDTRLIREITNEIFGIMGKLPADVDFNVRQKGRPITQDDITNLNILLNTTEDVSNFLTRIG